MPTDGAPPLISIVIPVYNGAFYLEKTVDSILIQSYPHFELLLVDDGSSDTSLTLLKSFEAQDARVRVFQTPSNLGIVPKVLNFVLPHTKGDYYFYASQDDLFSSDLLEKMVDRALATQADATIPDLNFYYETPNKKNRSLIGLRGDRSVELQPRQAVELSLQWQIPGNALWRMALVKKIGFYDFAMNADEYTVRVLFLNCNKVVFSEGTFFYRQDNINAITKKVSLKFFELSLTNIKICQFLRENRFDAILLSNFLKFSVGKYLSTLVSLEKLKANNHQLDGKILSFTGTMKEYHNFLLQEMSSVKIYSDFKFLLSLKHKNLIYLIFFVSKVIKK